MVVYNSLVIYIQKRMHFLNLLWAECKQQQHDGDDNMDGIFTLNVLHLLNTIYMSINFDCVWAPSIIDMNRVHLFSSRSTPALSAGLPSSATASSRMLWWREASVRMWMKQCQISCCLAHTSSSFFCIQEKLLVQAGLAGLTTWISPHFSLGLSGWLVEWCHYGISYIMLKLAFDRQC